MNPSPVPPASKGFSKKVSNKIYLSSHWNTRHNTLHPLSIMCFVSLAIGPREPWMERRDLLRRNVASAIESIGGAQPGRERTTLAPAQRITLKAAADTGHERKTERSARAARFCTTGAARADTRDEAGQQQTHVKMSDPTNAQYRGARVPAAGGGCDGCAGAPGSARDGMRAGVGRGRPHSSGSAASGERWRRRGR